jgi:uncharacterized protein (TIGR04255 family)
MESDIIPESHDLPNKPLVEAFVELRWKVDEDAARSRRAFRLLFARYYDKVQNEYPTLEDLPIAAVPEEMVPQVVRHRFRVGENKWPLTQLVLKQA